MNKSDQSGTSEDWKDSIEYHLHRLAVELTQEFEKLRIVIRQTKAREQNWNFFTKCQRR